MNDQLRTLEAWSPRLFLVGAGFEFLFAVNNGLAYLLDGFSFVEWLYPTVLLGRGAVLLALAGLSVRIAARRPRLARWGRVVLAVALAFTAGLFVLSLLEAVGVSTPIIAVFGLGTVVLTITTHALFGVVVLRSGAFSPAIGGLLLAVAAAISGVFVGLTVLPTELVGGVGEAVVAALFLATWSRLRAEPMPTDRADPSPHTVVE